MTEETDEHEVNLGARILRKENFSLTELKEVYLKFSRFDDFKCDFGLKYLNSGSTIDTNKGANLPEPFLEYAITELSDEIMEKAKEIAEEALVEGTEKFLRRVDGLEDVELDDVMDKVEENPTIGTREESE